MAHPLPLLQVANACHPDMDDHERWLILSAVERETGAPPEVQVYLREPRQAVGAMVAMDMLKWLEEPYEAPGCDEEDASSHLVPVLTITFAVLVFVSVWRLTVSWLRPSVGRNTGPEATLPIPG